MNSRKNKSSQKKEGSHLTILLILFVVAAVILCLIFLFGQGSKVKSPETDTNYATNGFVMDEEGAGGIVGNKTQKGNVPPSPQPQKTANPTDGQATKDGSANSTTTSDSSQSQVAILCTEETSIFCALRKTNTFASFLDNNPFATGIFIGGKKVMVEKISHQLVFRALENNKITDSTGKTLASSSVAYKETTKELVVLIGADKKYYQSLNVSEQKTLYTSQLVRAIFSVTEEIPSNYPKVAKIVGRLSYWDPNSE